MLPLHCGTIVLAGSSSGLIGRGDHLNFAVGKVGLRAWAQVMARALGSEGVHVVHGVCDADMHESESDPTDSREGNLACCRRFHAPSTMSRCRPWWA